MTKLLAQAFEKASSLSEALQDQLAQEVLEEMAWEASWDKTLAGTQDKLDRLAERAEQAHRAGKTKEMGFDELCDPTSRGLHLVFPEVAAANSAPRS